MADSKPTLHHMNVWTSHNQLLPLLMDLANILPQSSQSQRLLWLLEELEIPYDLVSHVRNPPGHPKAFLSPDSLLAVGPYGKAPVLYTGAADGNRYIPESSAIATYLIRTFDTEDKFGLKDGDWIRDEVLTSICGTGLGRSTSMLIFLDFGMIRNGDEKEMGPAAKNFDGPEMRRILTHLERELKEGPPGGYFMGTHPGRADIMLEFPLTSILHRKSVHLKAEFPLLYEWLERIYARPAWKRGIEKGNGYDMSIFPKKPHL